MYCRQDGTHYYNLDGARQDLHGNQKWERLQSKGGSKIWKGNHPIKPATTGQKRKSTGQRESKSLMAAKRAKKARCGPDRARHSTAGRSEAGNRALVVAALVVAALVLQLA